MKSQKVLDKLSRGKCISHRRIKPENILIIMATFNNGANRSCSYFYVLSFFQFFFRNTFLIEYEYT